jgi:phospholipid/cholesterol/gamma-HCH transport system substrate-binding protein
MNNLQQSARVGLFFVFGVALVWVAFETLSGSNSLSKNGYDLIAGFENLKELKFGDEVRVAGVKVGSVASTRLDGRRAVAVLRIDHGITISGDATASIAMSGLIGTNFVAIDLGSPGVAPLAPGAEIHTVEAPDINTIMSDLGDLGKKLDSALSTISSAFNGNGSAGGLFQKLDKLVSDNSEKITTTMANLQDITNKINNGQGTLGKLVNDPQLHDELVSGVNDLKALVANAQNIVDQIKAGKGSLGVLIYDPQAAANLQASIQNIRDVSDKLARGEGTLGKLINDPTLYDTAQSTLKKADRAIDSLNDSGPITAVGIVANELF